MSRRLRLFVAAAALLVAVPACSLAPGQENAAVDLEQNEQSPPPSTAADIIEEVLPSVVSVRVTAARVDPTFGDIQEGEGLGSGVVIDSDGIIVTNNHVVADATEVSVVFNDNQHGELDGQVLGVDSEKDLAVIKVDADDLDPVDIGRSSSLRLGDSVVALGFPLGLRGGPTVTQGIISGLDRSINVGAGESGLEGLLQTDAAINPGNSGGPLIDLNGSLVGINTAAAQAGAAENIGFAIAIDRAFPVIEQILTQRPEERAWLGVTSTTVTPGVAVQLGLDPATTGIAIIDVAAGSAAAEAGIRPGDVITRLGDRVIETSTDLEQAIKDLDPGDRVEVDLVGVSGTRAVEVTLGQAPPA